ncbi:2-succinyl-6-hydroxy-2,4-cyclohexadiene-1-carboxylate synthase [Sporosarcina limicola]|uniref:Putative 2-succinyl-6-hydroxy-2,4-cyclohexadiene-1-carboxylate synthase n=1 Tax=Sporosarcina limicola TaxID=34101 RepID=A0A927R703_9BACL|nr:2-succinyl-6-hydroxy-2,4-cyclohexadiene-1-carboxylate synthase [Sporosarcina limicola]MBE1555464.1 2-succinyl-6-hydroxy-2,4-cyclohexadiene-1-carboxylate synthase [Sporosarcina limicola]
MNDKRLRVRGIELHMEINGDENLPVIVFLHGFTGSTATWREISKLLEGKYRTIAVDLTGHGKSTVPQDAERYTMEQQIEDLEELFETLLLDHFTLIGYSMGGRVALGYTVHYPERVSTLILESSSPGLKTEEERIARKDADRRLAERLLISGMEAFIDFWESISLFDSQKGLSCKKRLAVREERLSQSVMGLSNSLYAIGTGSQPSYWAELETINLPVLLITGEIDMKFVNIAREMMQFIPNVHHYSIKGTGHAIHVEKPRAFATMVEEHISECENRGGIV